MGEAIKFAILAAFALVVLFPLIYAFLGSMKTMSEYGASGLNIFPSRINFENYRYAWNEVNFSRYTWNTVFYSVVLTTIQVTFASMSAFAVARLDFIGKKLLIYVAVSFMFISFGSSTLYPLLKMATAMGLSNSLWGLIIVQSRGPILAVLIIGAYLRSMGKEIDEAAIIDGCSVVQRWVYVMVPLAKPMIATQVILLARNQWNQYMMPLAFTLGRPEIRTLPVGMTALRGTGNMATNLPALSAAAIIGLIPMLLVYAFFHKSLMKAVSEGAVKG